MPPRRDPLGRAVKILGLFQHLVNSGKKMTLTELSRYHRCSKAAIMEMVEQINQSREVVIDTWKENRQRWYQAKRPHSVSSGLQSSLAGGNELFSMKAFGQNWEDSEGKPFLVKVIFVPEIAPYIREKHWGENQRVTELDNGAILMQFLAQNQPAVMAWLLGFGAKAKLLHPPALRRSILQAAREIVKQYHFIAPQSDDW